MNREHPGQRLLDILQAVINRAATRAFSPGTPAKELWCRALGVDATDRRAFVQSVRGFQDLLEDWERFYLTSESVTQIRQDIVNDVFLELNSVVLNLREMDWELLADTCQRLKPTIGIGIGSISSDYEWQDDQKEALLKEALELRQNVIESSIDAMWKRNILEALDRVIDAIENFEIKGSNHLTDTVIKLGALLHISRAVAGLTSIAGDITSRLVEIVERFGDGGPPALGPG